MDPQYRPGQQRRGEGKVIFGVAIVAAGILMLLRMLHILPHVWFNFHSGWPVIVLIIGIVMGVRSNFKNNAWWILCLIGAAHLIPSFYIGDIPSNRLLWPVVLIAAGLAVIFRKKKPDARTGDWRNNMNQITAGDPVIQNNAGTLNIDVTFGGRKEMVTSKEFRGGTINVTFGGAEINLMSADSTIQPMILDVRVAFGSAEIIVPSHWDVVNEINPTMGSVEDQRMLRTPDASVDRRTLILRGSCAFGSIEIKGY
jgi:hypothetical protein